MVITGLTRNQFASNRTWVRIPHSPPKNNRNLDTRLRLFLYPKSGPFGIFEDKFGVVIQIRPISIVKSKVIVKFMGNR